MTDYRRFQLPKLGYKHDVQRAGLRFQSPFEAGESDKLLKVNWRVVSLFSSSLRPPRGRGHGTSDIEHVIFTARVTSNITCTPDVDAP